MEINGINQYMQTQSAIKAEKKEKQAFDDFLKIKEDYIKQYELKSESSKDNDDWRTMSDKEWDKMMAGVDKYIDGVREELEHQRELQEEAARKGALEAPADQKSIAASKAALKVIV